MSNSNPGKTLANRPFGLIFGGIFLIIALFPLLWGNELRWWAGWVSAGFILVALIFPRLLTPLNQLWVKFGLLMHKITNPILMGLIFFLTVLPTGLILRLLGKDPMRRKFMPNEETYWIERKEHQITDKSFDQQF
jgi:hypothetical protein